MNEEKLERLGEIIDTLENLVCATSLPMPAEFHLEHFRDGVNEEREKLKELYDELNED